MNVIIKCIGVVDNDNKLHKVNFDSGINIITGKSSTGKSAIIEIFDYCFGSADFTIPHGVITQNAKIYFTLLKFDEKVLVLARGNEATKKNAYIKEFEKIDMNEINLDFFEQDYFIPLNDFKVELGKYFGLDIENTNEDLQQVNVSGNKPRPTIRDLPPVMLQR